MSTATAILLGIGVAAAWLGAIASLRLSPLSRVHAVTFVNIVAGAAITAAAWLTDGATPLSAKILLIWIVLALAGALGSHVTGRAIHSRSGERR